jgi:hypothetical protein
VHGSGRGRFLRGVGFALSEGSRSECCDRHNVTIQVFSIQVSRDSCPDDLATGMCSHYLVSTAGFWQLGSGNRLVS